MNHMKRLLAMLLALVMIVGVLPLSVFADEYDTATGNFAGNSIKDTAVIFSDLHTSSSNYKETTVKEIMGALKNANLPISSVTSAGDAFSVNSDSGKYTGKTSTISGYIRTALGNSTLPVNYVWSDHDRYALQEDDKTLLDKTSHLVYGAGEDGIYGNADDDNYYIYVLSMADTSSNDRYSAGFNYTATNHTNRENAGFTATVELAIENFRNDVEGLDRSKPLLIVGHQPLLDRRDDNAWAEYWVAAINEVAKDMDVAYFFGHNHNHDKAEDYYYAKGSQMPVPDWDDWRWKYNTGAQSTVSMDSVSTTLNFTHICAGYMAPSSTGSTSSTTREGAVLAVTVTDNKLQFTTYNKNGVYSTGYGVNITIDRDHANANVPKNLAVTGKIDYQVGDTIKAPSSVKVTYMDGNVSELTEGYSLTKITKDGAEVTLADNQFTEAGSYVLTYTCTVGNYQAQAALTVTVSDNTPVVTGIKAVSNKSAYALGEDLDLTVYEVYSDGTMVEIEGYKVSGYNSSKLGTQSVFVSYGIYTATVSVKVVDLTAESVLTGLLVNYSKEALLGGTLTLKVTAVYAGGTFVELTEGQYTVSGYNPNATGTQSIIVTYENQSYGFNIVKTNDVTVLADGMNSMTVTDVTETLTDALAEQLKPGFVAYDIVPDAYNVEKNVATVSMPAPEGANAVYYWNKETQTLEPVSDVTFENGKAVFTTDHFSTYVVGEDNSITMPDPETVPGTGSVVTTTKKTVYVLVSTPTEGNQYIIVNRNSAGSGYALKENTTTGSSITVNAAGNGISAPWIETTDETIMWNATSGLKFQSENGGYYLRYNNGLSFSTSNSTNWTYSSSNTLYYRYSSSRNYYLYNSDGTWTASRYTSDEVYLYEKQTVEVETTTTVSGTYSIAGNPAEITKVVKNGSTMELGSILTFQPTSGTATTTENPTGVTYTEVEGGDPNGVISGISGNTVTFSGKYGKALVKVSYTTDFGEVTNYITITTTEPTYVLDIISGGNPVTGTTVPVKGVTASTTLQLGSQIQFVDENGAEIVELPEGATLEWNIPAEYQSIATIDQNGLLTFKGVDGAFYVTATLIVGGKDYTVGVNISATTSQYANPNDGTEDFPEYPNEGAIRFDKTATAVGNFSQTGIAQIELSMTGVPYTTGNRMDVVLMLDRSSSMDKASIDRIGITIEATKAFIKNIVINEDGTFNGNRILVLDFLGGNLAEGKQHQFESNRYTESEDNGYQIINDQAELDKLLTKIETDFKGQTSLYGTEYAKGLEECYNALANSRADGNQQFCVFMSDGIPNYMMGEKTHFESTNAIAATFNVTNRTAANGTATRNATKYEYEYYSTKMKNEGVTVFTVGLGLKNTNSSWANTSKEVCEQVANMLLNDIAGPAYETAAQRDTGNTVSKRDKYFFSVADDNAAADMKNVFSTIAQKILQAATDVTVEDQITKEYTMIFDIPEGSKDITGVTNDFYIEFGKYALDEDHERTTFTPVTKLYLQNTNGELSAKDATAPVFEQKTIGDKGTLYYWTTDSNYASKAAVSYTVGETTYYFFPYGIKATNSDYNATKWFNMTSGAYANGTVDATNMSQNLVIATPYFVYNAATKMIYWTVDKLDATEYVLRYFLYLDRSATEVGTDNERDPGSYPTNDHAYLTYTNFKGHDCRQEFVKPQMTWSGAQVSYVFYLVNAQGQPINKSGQVVDFANAVFVTDIYTETTVWNKGEDGKITADSQLSQEWLAKNLLPSDYMVYDLEALYKLHVYGDHTGESIFDYFTIGGGEAADISNSLNSRLGLGTTATTVSLTTTKVYNTKAGEKITGYGTYTSKATDKYDNETVLNDFDFYNTTVAFAVVWQPRLVEDTVVVDFGLDVIINVVANDILQNSVSGIGLGNSAYGNTAMNTGVSTTRKLGTAKLEIDGNTISIENETSIRFHQGDMEFTKPVVFYYETSVEFWQGSHPTNGFMYSMVTVIPATTIYYEDEYVTLKTYTSTGNTDENGKTIYNAADGWDIDSVNATATQAQDRPGVSQISKDIDADNNYGFDAAYSSMSQFSMGSAAMTKVNAGKYATATFTFYGTGFDIISLTSATTGIITINVYQGAAATGNPYVSETVDTYYSYECKYYKVTYTYNADTSAWEAVTEEVTALGESEAKPEDPTVVNSYVVYETRWSTTATNNSNALYQVPVMKIGDGKTTAPLPYGQYTVVITATYIPFLDHNKSDAGYDFYLDAIRIYDPANDGATGDPTDNTIEDAYIQDGEYLPDYFEVRDQIISKGTFDSLNSETIGGIVFIDGNANNAKVTDYVSYGPNNEVYLANGQAIAFNLNGAYKAPVGMEVAKIQLAVKTVGGTGTIEVYGINKDGVRTDCLDETISTATDMYYDITKVNGQTVVIKSTGDAIISITNVKVTYKEPDAVETNSTKSGNAPEAAGYSLMSLRNSAAISTMATTEETAETTETYLFSVSAEMIERVLNMLNGKVEVEPERPFEPAPGKPSKPGSGNKPVAPKPSQPIKPSVPAKPIKPVRPVVPTMPVNPGLPGIPGRPAPVVAIHIY